MDKFMNLSQFDIGWQYMRATETILVGMISMNNERVIVSDHLVTEEEYRQATRYNSNSIMTPALFCLHQGIELLLKGFITYKARCGVITHDANELISAFDKYFPNETDLKTCFEDIISNPPIFVKAYMAANNIRNWKELYFSLRYPDRKDAMGIDYWYIHYPEEAYPRESEQEQVEALILDLHDLIKQINYLLEKAVSVYNQERIYEDE